MIDDKIAQPLLHLVCWGLHPQSLPTSLPDSIGNGNGFWPAVYTCAGVQGVLAITWDGLRRVTESGLLPSDRQPDRELLLRWAYNVEQIEKRNFRQKRVLADLAGFYAAHGIDLMLLKGYGMSLNYPIPNHRPCGDLDIWLYGRQKEADALLHKERDIAIDKDKHHHTVFRLDGVMVENHYDFLNVHSHRSNKEIDRLLKCLAKSGTDTTIRIGNVPIRIPHADFNALFLLRHAAVHFAAIEIRLRHVTDRAMFVERYHDQIDWIALERVAESQNMTKFLYCLNALSIDFLGLDPVKIPPFERDGSLEKRVLNDILGPEFSVRAPKGGGLVRSLYFKTRRWWANRWKHRIVYRESLPQTFIRQFWSHLRKPRSLK